MEEEVQKKRKRDVLEEDSNEESAKRSSSSESLSPDEVKKKPTKTNSDEDARPMCMYGLTCYRKNPAHFKEFKHPPGHPSAKQK